MSVESVGPIPSELPAPLINPHEFQRFDVAATQVREQGDLRRRARFRTVAQRASVQWLFTQAQFDSFWDWYEATLDAGALGFDVNVAAQGIDGVRRTFRSVWWVAQFASPYRADVLNSGPRRKLMYRVSADLVLRGSASATRPAGTFRAAGRIQHSGSAISPAVSILAAGDVLHDGGFYGLIVSPRQGRVTMQGWGPWAKRTWSAAPSAGSIICLGRVPEIRRTSSVASAAGAISISGNEPTVIT